MIHTDAGHYTPVTSPSKPNPLPSGYEYYVLKYDNENDMSPYARIEYASSGMCRDAGIRMPFTGLRSFDKATHFLIRRFDRVAGEKTHMQPFEKYTALKA